MGRRTLLLLAALVVAALGTTGAGIELVLSSSSIVRGNDLVPNFTIPRVLMIVLTTKFTSGAVRPRIRRGSSPS